MSQFDTIARQYIQRTEIDLIQKYCIHPLFRQVAGDLTGKKVLDAACGTGILTRLVKQLGAQGVTGFDDSKEMIEIANRQELIDKLDITYVRSNALQLHDLGKFDVITAGFLFNYARSIEELQTMVTGLSKNLKPGGRIISIVPNPETPLRDDPKYGVTSNLRIPPINGCERYVAFYRNQHELFSFITYYWDTEAFNKAFPQKTFYPITWHQANHISDEGKQNHPGDFWDDYVKSPHLIIFEVRKRV